MIAIRNTAIAVVLGLIAPTAIVAASAFIVVAGSLAALEWLLGSRPALSEAPSVHWCGLNGCFHATSQGARLHRELRRELPI
jgi:hypothetical protein